MSPMSPADKNWVKSIGAKPLLLKLVPSQSTDLFVSFQNFYRKLNILNNPTNLQKTEDITKRTVCTNTNKSSSEDEIANVNVLRRLRTCRGQSLRPLN